MNLKLNLKMKVLLKISELFILTISVENLVNAKFLK